MKNEFEKKMKYVGVILYLISLIFFSVTVGLEIITVGVGIIKFSGFLFFISTLYVFLFFVPTISFRKFFYIYILIGIGCRIFLSLSTPLWEDDWARYLWEGSLVLERVSPYSNPPLDFFDTGELITGDRGMEILSRINHPDWPAIYTPIILFYFALCSFISPFSIFLLKISYIIIDLSVVSLIKSMSNKKAAILYFLSPILLREIFINAHFELIPIFFLLSSIYFQKKNSKEYPQFSLDWRFTPNFI